MKVRTPTPIVCLVTLALSLTAVACDGVTESDPEPEPENVIGPGGGALTVGALTLNVPAGALSSEVAITVEPVTPASTAVPGGYLVVDGTAYNLGPDGLTFQQPAEVALTYGPGDLPPGVREDELAVLVNDGGVTALESTVDPAAGVVRAALDHFSAVVVGMEEGEYQRVACPNLSPAASQGRPLDRIELGRLPDDFEPPLWARVDADDEEGAHLFTLVRLDETSGEAELVGPIHPSTSPEGGEARILVTDGTLGCLPFDFTVEALQPAPGELTAIADHLQAILEEQAAVLGTSTDEILATPVEELPPALYPLALAQSTLDHPANDRSLAAIADGTSPEATPARLDLVEPLLARIGLRTELAATAARLQGPRTRPSPPSSPGSPRAGPQRAIEAGLCTPELIGNGEARLLDSCMSLARDAAFERGNPTGQIIEDLGKALGVLGIAPGVGGAAADVMGFATWLYLNQQERNAALLPSFFTGMTLDADPLEYLEDQGHTGTWHAEVTASNSDWDMGKEILEGLLQAAGLVSGLGEEEIAGPEVHDILEYILTGPVADELLDGGTIEEFQIDSRLFGPVSVTSDEWSESRIATGTAVELTSHNEYEPREVGTATLGVRTRTGAFGGQQATDDDEITVKQLQVTISPDEVFVPASDPDDLQFVEFQVEVHQSDSPDMVDLDLSDHPRQGNAEIRVSEGGSVHYVDYVAPVNPNRDEPDLVVVRHTAETGARKDGPPRTAIATVRFADLTISPRSVCLDAGESQQFSAEVTALDDQSVVWTASAGTIDDNGLYTADPDAPPGSTVTITATSASEPDLSDEVTIQIGQCDLCVADVTLSGGFSGHGKVPAAFSFQDGVLTLGFEGDTFSDPSGARLQGGATASWNGEPGTVDITGASVVNRETNDWAQYDPDDPDGVLDCATCGGTLTIDEATAEAVTGSLEVTMRTIGPSLEHPPTTAWATFRAALVTPDPHDFDPFRACVAEWKDSGTVSGGASR